MKHLLYIFLILGVFSCKNDDEIDCSYYTSIASKSIFIKLIDSNGNNLIENETYAANTINIVFGDYTFTDVVFEDVLGIENLIALNIFGNQGDNQFRINLSENETDLLILNIDKQETVNPCVGHIFTLNSATYNGVIQTLENFDGDYLITVIK